MTSPSERIVKPGFENRVPRTSDDFAQCWQQSEERRLLLTEIDAYLQAHPPNSTSHSDFALARKMEKSKAQRERSPYTLSYWGQIKLCIWRDVQRLKADPSIPLSMLVINFVEALIIASIFFNLAGDTASFFSRGAVLFMLVSFTLLSRTFISSRTLVLILQVLLNAFASMLEVFSLYAKRDIVEKVRQPSH
jgi:hypothetical protein